MSKITSIDELSSFTQNEQKILKELGLKSNKTKPPSKKSIDFILNFSKAYSVRNSKTIGKIEGLLN